MTFSASRQPAGGGGPALSGQPGLDGGLRHLLRDDRPRRRPEDRGEVHGHPVRPRRPANHRRPPGRAPAVPAARRPALRSGRLVPAWPGARRRLLPWEYRSTRGGERMACFHAFLHNHWAGLAILAGTVLTTPCAEPGRSAPAAVAQPAVHPAARAACPACLAAPRGRADAPHARRPSARRRCVARLAVVDEGVQRAAAIGPLPAAVRARHQAPVARRRPRPGRPAAAASWPRRRRGSWSARRRPCRRCTGSCRGHRPARRPWPSPARPPTAAPCRPPRAASSASVAEILDIAVSSLTMEGRRRPSGGCAPAPRRLPEHQPGNARTAAPTCHTAATIPLCNAAYTHGEQRPPWLANPSSSSTTKHRSAR